MLTVSVTVFVAAVGGDGVRACHGYKVYESGELHVPACLFLPFKGFCLNRAVFKVVLVAF